MQRRSFLVWWVSSAAWYPQFTLRLGTIESLRCDKRGPLVALKWSDFDWENLSVYIRRAIVAGRVDDVKTEYSEAPLPLDPALAEVIFEWRRRTGFSAGSDFV